MKAKRDMGKIIQKARLQNSGDLSVARSGKLPLRKVRSLDVEFLVDTGAAMLCLPPKEIETLGLRKLHEREVVTANGVVKRGVYEPVFIQVLDREANLDVMGRQENFDVIEVPENVPNLLGQVPLEVLDFVVDGKAQRLIPNPAHGGKQMTEEY